MVRAETAMVLAAGLGTRMRPLTDHLPKPLIAVGGKTMLDHTLDGLAGAGVTSAVVNVHYLGDAIEDHLARREALPRTLVSDERALILDSGGGVVKALPHLGDPFFVRNADTFWIDARGSNLLRMADRFDPETMDCLLLLATREISVGFDGPGDFFMADDGRLTRRGSHAAAPFIYAGAALFARQPFEGLSADPFSLNRMWDRSIQSGRLYGLAMHGLWLHVGTPQALPLAEQAIAAYRP